MNRLRSFFLVLLFSVTGTSCFLRLPDAEDMDRYYEEVARTQLKERADDLDSRRASGDLDEAGYKRERAELDRVISDRAATLAWTAHDLREKGRAAQQLPTPTNSVAIAVPQAGSLPTGSQYRRFNQNDMTNGNGSSVNTMRELISGQDNSQNIAPPVRPVVEQEEEIQQ